MNKFEITTKYPEIHCASCVHYAFNTITHKGIQIYLVFFLHIPGIPIIKIIFADSPSLSLITIPLLVYHPTQILLGGLLVPSVRNWMLETSKQG